MARKRKGRFSGMKHGSWAKFLKRDRFGRFKKGKAKKGGKR